MQHVDMPEARKRATQACDSCSRLRIRCNGHRPCSPCQSKRVTPVSRPELFTNSSALITPDTNRQCAFTRLAKRRGPKANKQKQKQQQHASAPVSTPRSHLAPASSPPPRPRSHHADNSNSIRPDISHLPLAPATLDNNNDNDADADADVDANSTGLFWSNPIADTAATTITTTTTSGHALGQASASCSLDHPAFFSSPLPPVQQLRHRECNTRQYEPHARYACLSLVAHLVEPILSLKSAVQLLDYYFTEPNTSCFTSASPFVLSPVIRQASLLDHHAPRSMSPALVLTILWICAHTAHHAPLLIPRQRRDICDRLGELVLVALSQSGQLSTPDEHSCPADVTVRDRHLITASRTHLDDFLAFLLFIIKRSADDFRIDCPFRWQQAVCTAKAMKLHLLDDSRPSLHRFDNESDPSHSSQAFQEAKEERRRVFWLLFALDRHWALSYNTMPLIMEHDCFVFIPLPDDEWAGEVFPYHALNQGRTLGPPHRVTGCGSFEFFLPLMKIQGDVLWLHHQRCHPRFASVDDGQQVSQIEFALSECFMDLEALLKAGADAGRQSDGDDAPCSLPPQLFGSRASVLPDSSGSTATPAASSTTLRATSVGLYGLFITHVQYMLLYGRWDALDMLSPPTSCADDAAACGDNPVSMSLSDWVTSPHFAKCASHAIAAAETVSKILEVDPELAYMPYLFGIYLLHGSFVLLFFAHRMLDVGGQPNQSVELACETIIRAHEVSVATLSAEFQKDFRKVLRAVLHDVRHSPSNSIFAQHTGLQSLGEPGLLHENITRSSAREHNTVSSNLELQILRDVLGLYRWTNGYHGLAI